MEVIVEGSRRRGGKANGGCLFYIDLEQYDHNMSECQPEAKQ